jgi:hypothetical protein
MQDNLRQRVTAFLEIILCKIKTWGWKPNLLKPWPCGKEAGRKTRRRVLPKAIPSPTRDGQDLW